MNRTFVQIYTKNFEFGIHICQWIYIVLAHVYTFYKIGTKTIKPLFQTSLKTHKGNLGKVKIVPHS